MLCQWLHAPNNYQLWTFSIWIWFSYFISTYKNIFLTETTRFYYKVLRIWEVFFLLTNSYSSFLKAAGEAQAVTGEQHLWHMPLTVCDRFCVKWRWVYLCKVNNWLSPSLIHYVVSLAFTQQHTKLRTSGTMTKCLFVWRVFYLILSKTYSNETVPKFAQFWIVFLLRKKKET